jgi:hypothetical protein
MAEHILKKPHVLHFWGVDTGAMKPLALFETRSCLLLTFFFSTLEITDCTLWEVFLEYDFFVFSLFGYPVTHTRLQKIPEPPLGSHFPHQNTLSEGVYFQLPVTFLVYIRQCARKAAQEKTGMGHDHAERIQSTTIRPERLMPSGTRMIIQS